MVLQNILKVNYRFVPALLTVLLLIAGSVASAKPTVIPLTDLVSSENQRQTALIIAKVIEKFHYTRPNVDNQLSSRSLDRYFESLDPNKTFFTKQSIANFTRFRNRLDDGLKTGQIEPAFVVFRSFRARVEQRVAYAKELLASHDFDFSRSEVFRFDRSELDWAVNDIELDNIWRKRVKNDILTLRLQDKQDDEIRETLTKRYDGIVRRVRQMTSDDVFQTFVNAFLLSIEPHTTYMSPRLSENFDIGMRLSLQGIGAVLRADNEYTVIQRTVPGGPAARSGQIDAGDRIVGVAQDKSGQFDDVIGWRLQDVVNLIRGPKGSTVRLKVLPKREGVGGRERDVVLVRDEIKLEDKAAKAEIIEGRDELKGMKIGVIDIPTFYRDFAGQAAGDNDFRSTTRDVRELLKELQDKGVDGIIVDLRNNGGGSLTEATELTGLFIEKGPVVQVRDARGNVEVERDPDPELVYAGPLAVLVNRNSASASEIFSGAIQDYDRGLILGEPTFGKGTVQTLVDIRRFLNDDQDRGRLRLTMAQFFRVDGSSTQHRGVTPDVIFPTSKGASDHGERSLKNAIPWAEIEPAFHQKLGGGSVALVRGDSDRRIALDPGFQYLIGEENDAMRINNQEVISLNEAERRAEWERREAKRLERLNRLRVFRGLEPLASLDEDEDEELSAEDEDPEGINRIMLDESANILADFIAMQRPVTAQLN